MWLTACAQAAYLLSSLPTCRALVVPRYLYAARELGYASLDLKQDGPDLEANRNWQFVNKNGKDSVFDVSAWQCCGSGRHPAY